MNVTRSSTARQSVGVGLYGLTLAGEALVGAPARWVFAYATTAIISAIFALDLSIEALAWIIALAPLAWSLTGFALPGRGWVWSRCVGARRASAEEAVAVADALVLLRSAAPSLPAPAAYYVLDDPLPAAAVRGRTIIFSRGLIESDSLSSVFAHELGHVNTLDGRLTEALKRLALWDDPLCPVPAGRVGEARVDLDDDPEGAFLWGLLRWTMRLAGGGFALRLLSPLWAAHWRACEYAADAYAGSLGQAEDLARHLAEQELLFDVPQRRLLFNSSPHPPVALRVERLSSGLDGEWS